MPSRAWLQQGHRGVSEQAEWGMGGRANGRPSSLALIALSRVLFLLPLPLPPSSPLPLTRHHGPQALPVLLLHQLVHCGSRRDEAEGAIASAISQRERLEAPPCQGLQRACGTAERKRALQQPSKEPLHLCKTRPWRPPGSRLHQTRAQSWSEGSRCMEGEEERGGPSGAHRTRHTGTTTSEHAATRCQERRSTAATQQALTRSSPA